MALKLNLLFLTLIFSVSYGRLLITSHGDEEVVIQGGKVKCGILNCPEGSTGCIIRKVNNNKNNRLVDITRRCMDSKENITAEQNEQFEVKNGERYNVYLNSGSQKVHELEVNPNLDKQKQQEIEEKANILLREIQEEIQSNVLAGIQRFEKQLKDLGFAYRKL